MTRLSPSRCVLTIALACALGALPACGGDGPDSDTGALGSSVDPTPTTTATPTKKPRKTGAPTPSRTVTADEGGDGDAQGDDVPATAGGGVCGDLGAEEVGAVLGVTLSGAGITGGGCKFDQGGRRGLSVTVLDKSSADAGGIAGAKTEATSAVEGEPEDLTGIGSAAFVVTGTMFGGDDVQAAGAAQVGRRIISVFLVQRSAIPAAKMRVFEVDLLRLVAHEAS